MFNLHNTNILNNILISICRDIAASPRWAVAVTIGDISQTFQGIFVREATFRELQGVLVKEATLWELQGVHLIFNVRWRGAAWELYFHLVNVTLVTKLFVSVFIIL